MSMLVSGLPTRRHRRSRRTTVGERIEGLRGRLRGVPAPALAGVVAGVVAAVGWARWDTRHIATGDVGHFVRDRLWSELTSFFGYGVTGAGSGTYELARALELPFWALGRLVGSEAVGQGLYYVTLAAAAAAAGAYLARRFTDRRWPAVLAGVLAVVNPLTLITFPNPNTVLATVVAGTVGGLLLRPRRTRWDGLVLAAATLPASYLAVNPPTLAILVVWVVVVVAAAGHPEAPSTGTTVRRLARATPWVLLLHAWWMIPQALVLLGDSTPVSSGLSSVEGWSWSHRNNSLGRVVTLNAHWAWDDSAYFPYAPLLDRPGWSWTAYVLPVLALTGVLTARRTMRRAAVTLAGAALLAVMFATGLHPPLAPVGRWLYEAVPGWWLFREPVTKWGIVVLLAYVPLVALGLGRLADLAAAVPRPWLRRTTVTGVVLAGVMAVVYPWPLLTGGVAPVDRPGLPPARSTIPAEWQQVGDLLDGDPTSGKVLLLPVPTFYQTQTDWGFHGVPTVPLQLLRRPVIAPGHGGYFASGADTFTKLATATQEALLTGDGQAARRGLQALGATDVLLRLDQVPGPGQPLSAHPDELHAALRRVPWTTATHVGEHAAVFRVAPDARSVDGRVATYSDAVRAGDLTDLDASTAIVAQPRDRAVVSSLSRQPTALTVSSAEVLTPGSTVRPELSPGSVATPVRTGPTLYHAEVAGGTLRVRHAVTLDGRAPQPTVTPLGGQPLALEIAGESLPLGSNGALFGATPAGRARVLVAERVRPLDLRPGEFGDCFNADGRPLSDVAISHRIDRRSVTLRAEEHSACLSIDLPALGEGDLVVGRMQEVEGAPGRLCLHDPTGNRCVDRERAGGGRTVLLRPDADVSRQPLRLYLYADGSDRPSAVTYRDLAVVTTRSVDLTLPGPHGPQPVLPSSTPGTPPGAVTTEEPGPLADCHRTDDRTHQEAGLSRRVLSGGGVELTAEAHAACVTFELSGYVPGAVLDVRLDAERVTGQPPRLCLWADGPDRCLTEATLQVEQGRSGQLSARARVPLDTTALRIYVYADGSALGTTTVRYTRPDTTTDPGLRWLAAPDTSQTAPAVTVISHEPGRLRAVVAASDHPFLLVAADGDPDGWRHGSGLDGRVHGRAIVDGYAAGWVVGPGPATTVELEHHRDRTMQVVHLGWLGLLLLVLLIATVTHHTTIPGRHR